MNGSELECNEDEHVVMGHQRTTRAVKEEELDVISEAMEGIEDDQQEEAKRATLLYVTLHEVQRSYIRHFHLPDDTLYSATLAMPMIARSSGYQLSLTIIAVKMVVLNIFCMILQSILLMSIVVATGRLPHLSGVPNLCTYGQDVGDGRTPSGPNGMKFEKAYDNVETDYTMLVVRNNLWRVMEELNLTSKPAIGPVEYGSESVTCRFACVAVFCIAVCREMFLSLSMMNFLVNSPTQKWGEPQLPWVQFNEEVKRPTFDKELWRSIGKSNLDYVTFIANGAPLSWKLFTALLLSGHLFIVGDVFWKGVILLMDTGGIVHLILNSLAMTFIIDLDRVMFLAFTRALTREIMQRLQPYSGRVQKKELRNGYEEHRKDELEYSFLTFVWRTIRSIWPTLFMLGVTFLVHYIYFFTHCKLVTMPFNFGDWNGKAYFRGQTRVFGGWEFFFGAWRSVPIHDDVLDKRLCTPAIVADGKVLQPVDGCGWPTGWPTNVSG